MIKKITKYFFIGFTLMFLFWAFRLFAAQFKLDSSAMDETSGLAVSRIHPNILYVHNDSGDSPRFFAINGNGALKTTFNFEGVYDKNKRGVRDCEDIAIGPGPDSTKSYIYLGDIGNNARDRKAATVYRFEEPAAIPGNRSSLLIDAVSVHFLYPDGPRDAETLMIDPIDRLMYIISKREDSISVYATGLDFQANDTLMMERKCRISIQGVPGLKWITAGDISVDGQQVLLKSYEKVFYWKRKKNEPIWKTLSRKPIELPYLMELQGEAIGFDHEGKGYYTISEGRNAPVYYYKLP